MTEDIKDIEIAFRKLQRALLVDTEEEWDKVINENYEQNDNIDLINRIYIRVCGEVIIDKNSSTSSVLEYFVAKYDNDNIRITIDASRNHGRPHIHIGIKKMNIILPVLLLTTGQS